MNVFLEKSSAVRKINSVTVARLLLGGIFFIMGLDGFFHFISITHSVASQGFMNGLTDAKYFWPFEKSLEIFFGLLLIANRLVPLAVEGLAPIIVNIMLFHLFLDLKGIAPAIVVFVCEVILLIHLWEGHFEHLFQWDRSEKTKRHTSDNFVQMP